ncbi:MAG TPA: tetratricopeptide repeat protein, partial [Pirellulaceae bacterium]|nr:tetratricopeptide repeat protein [Pirellulaceae bacterium]
MVRRSIRWPVLAISVVGLGVLALGLYLLHRWQLSRTATGLIALADAQEREGDWVKSAQYLDRYLRLAADDGPARVRLALSFAKGATRPEDKNRAVELHYRALAAGLKDRELELRRDLARLLVEAGRIQEAEKEAQAVLLSEPLDPAAHRVLALALASQVLDGSLAGQAQEKIGLLGKVREARRLNPQDVDLAILLATLYRTFPEVVRAEHPELTEPARVQKATETLDLLVKDNPASAPAWLARYRYRAAYGLDGATADLAQAVKLAPDDAVVLLAAAEDALGQGTRVKQAGGEAAVVEELAARARTHYEQLSKLPRERLVAKTFLGWGDAWLLSNDVEQALRIWRDGLNLFAQSTVQAEFQGRIADSCLTHRRLKESEEAIDTIDGILAKVGASVTREQKLAVTRANELRRARLCIQKGDYGAAIPLLSQVVTSQSSTARDVPATVDALWLMGNALASQGEWRQAAMTHDEAARIQPNLPALRLAAAAAWLASGRPDLASERAEAALNVVESPEAWLSLAVSQLQLQVSLPKPQRNWRRTEEALAALDKARDRLRESPAWQVDLLRAQHLVQREQEPATGARQAAALLEAAEARYASDPNFW